MILIVEMTGTRRLRNLYVYVYHLSVLLTIYIVIGSLTTLTTLTSLSPLSGLSRLSRLSLLLLLGREVASYKGLLLLWLLLSSRGLVEILRLLLGLLRRSLSGRRGSGEIVSGLVDLF